jgi:hypothetical protein
MITVDSELWDRVHDLLREGGYSPGSLSQYIGLCVDDLYQYLSEPPYPLSPSSNIAQLEISRLGLAKAAEIFEWDIDEWTSENIDSSGSKK